MHDIIGDIHGHSTELLLLLGKLGYHYQNGTYRHPERQAVFLGDYIDRKIGEIRENERLYVGEQSVGNSEIFQCLLSGKKDWPDQQNETSLFRRPCRR